MGGPDPSNRRTATRQSSSSASRSRLLVVLLALTTVTVFAQAAIAGAASPSTPTDASEDVPATTLPQDVGEAEPRPLIEYVPEEVFHDANVLEDAAVPAAFPPTLEPTIRPGRQLLIHYPSGTSATCTMNFIYQVEDDGGHAAVDDGDYLIGTAGHCVLPGSMDESTHGDFQQPDVLVCVFLCVGSEVSSRAAQFWQLGDVLYARQEADGEELGEDYAFVKVPNGSESLIDPQTPFWNGPSGQHGSAENPLLVGEQLATYGQGVGYGDAELDTRTGAALPSIFGGSEGAFVGALPAAPGDSGGPILTHVDPLNVSQPDARAVGDLTHLVAGATAGTYSSYAIDFTYQETGVQLELATADGAFP